MPQRKMTKKEKQISAEIRTMAMGAATPAALAGNLPGAIRRHRQRPKRTRLRIAPPRELAFAWILPATRPPLEQLAKLLGQHEHEPDLDSAECAGRILDKLVPVMLKMAKAVVPAERRKGRKLTEAELLAVARRAMGLKQQPSASAAVSIARKPSRRPVAARSVVRTHGSRAPYRRKGRADGVS